MKPSPAAPLVNGQHHEAPAHLPRTLGALRASGYRPRSVKDELRDNLLSALRERRPLFPGILGYEDSVLPELQTAVLARHNILLLGLRGQAKTRIARQLTELLDEWTPVVEGTELNDDPLAPVSRAARDLIAEHGDATPVAWLHRSDRYVEKLATPDVSVADLIGDVDPIKAATLKLPYSDERVIHYGLAPRANRCIFVLNELPDLQPRIQVALFNLLQERDLQIRGFKMRLPVDVCFVFTANPEDYTNRGSIVTPLKDRIESQILTHYPKQVEIGMQITRQEAELAPAQRERIHCPELIAELVERIAFAARESEYVDPKSGVSARLTIAAYELVYAAAELRLLHSGEQKTRLRILDLYSAVPAITGKIELVYEGEQEGPFQVALSLINKSIKTAFVQHFPDPEKAKRAKKPNPYESVVEWFNAGNTLDLLRQSSDRDYVQALQSVKGLADLVAFYCKSVDPADRPLFMELLLNGLAEFSQISRQRLVKGFAFKDMLGSLFKGGSLDDEDE
jgi:magnesium chelatase subunit I